MDLKFLDSPPFDDLAETASREVARIVDSLPESVREPAGKVPVCFESRPDDTIIEEGLDPDLLGLFVGESHLNEGMTINAIPAQIILFLDNLWDYAEGRERIFRREVRKTYLHELGHYLGLEEDELTFRGMD